MSRILLLVPRMNIGGAETYVYSVAKELHNRGQHEVFVASGGGKFADKLEELGVKTVFLPVRFNRALAVFLLKRIIKKYKIDLVHANSGDAGVVAAHLKKDIDIPVVYTAHGIFGNMEREHVIDDVDRIICVSNFVREKAIGQGFTPEKLLTKYCGVDTKRFSPNAQIRTELRKEYGISDSTLVLAIVSRIKELGHKGHGALLDMFTKYASQDDWKLIVVGKGNGLPKLKHRIKQDGLQDKVICLGHRTDVEKILNMCDIYVSPTWFETFGLAIAEGMAVGKPAVAYEVGGTPEVINHGESGFLVKYNDIKDMYEKIKYLDTNRDVLGKMYKQSREWVLNNFTIDTMVDGLEEVYKDLLSK